jgi:hypothetical protein
MASLIKIKRSEVSGNPQVLGAGELAYSGLANNGSNGGDRLYIGMGMETDGNAVNHVVIGGKYFTDQITAATSLSVMDTIVRRDASGNFMAGTITAALSGNASTASTWLNPRDLSLSGDATATFAGVSGNTNSLATLTLATVNSNPGTFGSTTLIPVVTVNGKGLVTSVTTASISTALGIAGGTGTDTVTLGTDTLTFAGGTGVTTAVTNNQVSFAIGQAVGTTDNVIFNNVVVNGTLTSDDITSQNISVTGNATITGNLTVQGTTTTINSTAVAITDVNLTLAKDAANATAANGAGLTVAGAGATFTYTSVNDRWNLNKDLVVPNVYGALVGNADTATKLATARTINGVSFDGSANITINANPANALTIGTGLSGTSYNGSSAVTIAVDSTVALRADTHYVGTTAVALNRASANQELTGISSVTLPGATSGSVQIVPTATAGTGTVLTLPATTGTVITSGDTSTVTNAMLAGFIENTKLSNSSFIIGSTAIALGGTTTSLAGLASVTASTFTGALTGNASTATALATGRTIAITGDLTYTSPTFNGSGNVTAAGTLATVNSNTGSFGDSITVPSFTVNAKGLITAASSAPIPTATTSTPGLAKFDSAQFSVITGLVSITAIDGGTY